MSKIQRIADAVEMGTAKQVAVLVMKALNEGCDPTEILNRGMVDAMGDLCTGDAGSSTSHEERCGDIETISGYREGSFRREDDFRNRCRRFA